VHSPAPTLIGPTGAGAGSPRSAIVHLDLDGAEDIYHAHGWRYPHGDDPLFESGLKNALTLFERNSIQATLFVVSNSLDNPRKRELVIEALRRGHEVASHTETHPNRLRLTKEQKRLEIVRSREKLESLLGTAVRGFRAPGYQIDRECMELLADSGYEYDSSVFPTRTFARRLESSVAALSAPHHPVPGSPLWELPLPDHRPLRSSDLQQEQTATAARPTLGLLVRQPCPTA
jgi:peptidoglycan/xylan/chitin deacetylase (PgdA/CDA1 family)